MPSWTNWAGARCRTGAGPAWTPNPCEPREGEHTGPNPTDRAKPGSKPHLLIEATGLPLTCGVSAANVHDTHALRPLVRAVPAVRSRRGPRRLKPAKLHADKAYHSAAERAWIADRGIGVRIARPGVDSSERSGRHRYKVERTIAWLGGFRRLAQRWERKGSNFLAMLSIACILTCYRRLAKHSRDF
ncbi:hypothetical protein GCM10009799_52020 [Nocardiopsis rhodophaea]|uniref:Transposase IS4-like domain-containing protein n=1 Tax=Nocardiopsis rhodophaea TaxID=280238 RepID=A0ABP5F613_9ACTN